MKFVLKLAVAVLACTFSIARAQEFPPSQIRIVVPFTAGGGTDVITRIVAQHLSETWKVPVIIDNRVGAGGVVGSKWVAEQAPDGRTFLAVASAFGVRAAIDRTVPYDVTKDFTGVAQMARSPSFLVVSPERGFKNLRDLIEWSKKQPLGIQYASAGVGSTAHLHAAAVAYLAGLKAEHIPYRGTPEAVNDAMNGRVLYAFAPGPNAIPLARSGKLQILATTSPAGARFFPGAPTLTEQGVPYEGDDWFGVFAPAKTPLAIRLKMATEMQRILALPDVKERLATFGAEPDYMGPEQWEQFVAKYIAFARKLGDEVGIKPQ
jgi:tripartite-type tricarboxylate transporter receptor subunit TctC